MFHSWNQLEDEGELGAKEKAHLRNRKPRYGQKDKLEKNKSTDDAQKRERTLG